MELLYAQVKNRPKKGQVYFTDFMIAILIFALFTTMYFIYEPNLGNNQDEQQAIILEAKTIAASLVSEGVPSDWQNQTFDDILRMGILGEDRTVDPHKIAKFYNMSNKNYQEAKSIMDLTKEYYVYLVDKEGDKIEIDVDGIPTVAGGLEPDDPDKVSRLTRIVPYENSLANLVVLVWV
jgi:hypothetical protein